jgi:hypothetical protein
MKRLTEEPGSVKGQVKISENLAIKAFYDLQSDAHRLNGYIERALKDVTRSLELVQKETRHLSRTLDKLDAGTYGKHPSKAEWGRTLAKIIGKAAAMHLHGIPAALLDEEGGGGETKQ